MNKDKNSLVSSTPYPVKNRQLFNFFEDLVYSPINDPSQPKIPVEPQATTELKPPGVRKTGAVRKRKVAIKDKAPESVTAGVLRELGEKAQDICNNALSHSRNLYNMFPEPIILDSDEEEKSVTAKRPLKKAKENCSITQTITTENIEEKKTKQHVPGSSRTVKATRHAAYRKMEKQNIYLSTNLVSSSSKDIIKTRSQSKDETVNRPLVNKRNSPSVVILDDDDDDSLFPVYIPGSSVHQTSNKSKHQRKHPLSLELDDKFPIQWSARREKTADKKLNGGPDVQNTAITDAKDIEENNNKKINPEHNQVEKDKAKILTRREQLVENTSKLNGGLNVQNSDIPDAKEAEENSNKKRTTKRNGDEKNKGKILTRREKIAEDKSNGGLDVQNTDIPDAKEEKENSNKKRTTKHNEVEKNKEKILTRREKIVENASKLNGGLNVQNTDIPDVKEEEENSNKKRTTKHNEVEKNKEKILNGAIPKRNNDKNKKNKDGTVINELLPVISRFEHVKFKANHARGGILARCLRSDQNDVGYLEVPADEIFSGERSNITFVVIEGKAKAIHLGVEHTLVPGDMIHFNSDAGYQFKSAGTDNVRFLYIMSHI